MAVQKYLPLELPNDHDEIYVLVHGVYGRPFKATWHDGNPPYIISESGLQYWGYEISSWSLQ